MPDDDYPGPPAEPVEHYFPILRTRPPDHTFEIALVLAGTVSTGTYTAGVIDFLIEALDQWALAQRKDDAAQANGKKVPRHRVVVRVIAGASGGGIDAVLAARALSFSFPPASYTSPECERVKNPLFDLSVNTVDIAGLLATPDLEGNFVASLLCVEPLRNGVQKMLDFAGEPSPARNFVADPLPVFLTYTNIGGIPYKLNFSGAGERSEYFVNHADFMRFELGVNDATAPPWDHAPDALKVPAPAPGPDWKFMAQYLLGTSALPAGFPPVQVSRFAWDYRFRYFTWSDAGEKAHTDWLEPDWSKFIPPGSDARTRYQFLSLDGGATDNDPLELARTWLAGIGAHNPRDGASANRAVILVDPLTGPPGKPLAVNPGPVKMLFSLLDTLVQTSRYATADLSLLINPSVYSRFLVTPRRSWPGDASRVLTGASALAGSRLSAFMGYMARQFRIHDYMLGRRNCQYFLRNWFSLLPGNPLFFDPKPGAIPRGAPCAGEIPIIPLYGSADREQREPCWPQGAFNPYDIRAQLRARIRALLKVAEGGSIIAWLLCMVNRLAACLLARRAVKTINAELERQPSLK